MYETMIIAVAEQPALLCMHSKSIYDALQERPHLSSQLLESIDPLKFTQYKQVINHSLF